MKIRSLIPDFAIKKLKKIFFAIRLAKEYLYDYSFYLKHNSESSVNDAVQLEGKIIAIYHVLEKGFSHHNPKKLFSMEKFIKLIDLILMYDDSGFARTSQVNIAVNIINSYSKHQLNEGGIGNEILRKIDIINHRVIKEDIFGGFEKMQKRDYLMHINSGFELFANSRYSIRNYLETEVDVNVLKKAIKIAQKTPSVCNRQTCKAHVLTDKIDIMDHLAYHNGTRGFAELINKLIIVTSDIRYFEGVREKNQAFIEGGLFSMSLLYGLHHFGLGAVPLNWCYDKAHDTGIRSLKSIPNNERIVMLIAVGNIPETFNVAKSLRRPLEEICILR